MENKVVTKTKNKQGINYQGQVKIKIVRGKKVLASHDYYNNGRNMLFKYICNCLAGSYDSSYRPTRIKLFTIAANETPTSDFNEDHFKDTYSASPYIPTFITPVVEPKSSSNNSDAGYQVTYHFRIPFQRISKDAVYKAALYNELADAPETSMLAWFKFIENNSWSQIEVNKETNYSIIIEWTMTIENK